MKKVIICFISLLVISLMLMIIIQINDGKYTNELEKNIINNTDINNIKYINKYDNYYIVVDGYTIYLIDKKYEILLERDISLIHKNDNNYDIIYKDGFFMYFNDYIKNDILVYEYYDINTYKLTKRVFVGGSIDE